MDDLPAGTTKLIQYLNEAYGLERRLEVALQAHLAMAARPTYRKRLKDHLTETKRHAREVSKQIKRLGGTAETIELPGPELLSEVAQTAVAGVQRAAAAAQGPVDALRGTGEAERQLKNAKTEYASEAEEIATYSAIIALAESLGEREAAQLARAILREEQRMSSFLEKEIPKLLGDVARAEIPSGERNGARARRTSTARKRTTTARNASTARKTSTSGRAGAGKAKARKGATARPAGAARRRSAASA
jgi:ferritin-like metal-binding protein YciE